MASLAGNLPGFEEASRLFAGTLKRLASEAQAWPSDAREFVLCLAPPDTCPYVNGAINPARFELWMGSNANKVLQVAWACSRPQRFAFEMLELLEEREDSTFGYAEELRTLEQLYRDELTRRGSNTMNATARTSTVSAFQRLAYNDLSRFRESLLRNLSLRRSRVPSRFGAATSSPIEYAMTVLNGTNVIKRNNVQIKGAGRQTMIFAHGFGCDHNMWRYVAPAFENEYRVVLFDNVGAGGSDLSAFNEQKYATLHGYARDVNEILRAVGAEDAIFVGHSVSAVVGILASIEEPTLFDQLILVGPSPSYIDDGDYIGGFNQEDIEQMLDFLDTNYLGWSGAMAPAIMGNSERPDLASELENSFCRTEPRIAGHFARTTFLSDHRADLPKVRTPSLILQCSEDVIAPDAVGRYMHAQLAQSTFVQMQATGHCPNLSAPEETIREIRAFLGLKP